jgi:hypothetical protein
MRNTRGGCSDARSSLATVLVVFVHGQVDGACVHRSEGFCNAIFWEQCDEDLCVIFVLCTTLFVAVKPSEWKAWLYGAELQTQVVTIRNPSHKVRQARN